MATEPTVEPVMSIEEAAAYLKGKFGDPKVKKIKQYKTDKDGDLVRDEEGNAIPTDEDSWPTETTLTLGRKATMDFYTQFGIPTDLYKRKQQADSVLLQAARRVASDQLKTDVVAAKTGGKVDPKKLITAVNIQADDRTTEVQVRAWAPGGMNPRTKEPTPDRYGVTKVTTRYRTSVLASVVKEDEDSIRAALLGE